MKLIVFVLLSLFALNLAHENIYEHYNSMTNEEFAMTHLGLNIVDLSHLPKFDLTGYLMDAELPESFDARKQWPNCVHEIRAQLHCGSCWAFAGSEVLSDRVCIASNGQINKVLSPQWLVSCDKQDHACQGGRLDFEWQFMENTGVVADDCFPYQSGDGTTVPQCPTKCADGSALVSYKAVQGSSKLLDSPQAIKMELMANGPVETGIMVYDDFPKYTGGIYTQNSQKLLGGHAVKIVGWGKENGVEFWIIANSWGPSWGESGFFRMKFGECNVDSDAIAGQADITTRHSFLQI